MRHLLLVLVCLISTHAFAGETGGYVCNEVVIKQIQQGNPIEIKAAAVAFLSFAQSADIAKNYCSKENANMDTTHMTLPEITMKLSQITTACEILKGINEKLNSVRPCLNEATKYVNARQ